MSGKAAWGLLLTDSCRLDGCTACCMLWSNAPNTVLAVVGYARMLRLVSVLRVGCGTAPWL